MFFPNLALIKIFKQFVTETKKGGHSFFQNRPLRLNIGIYAIYANVGIYAIYIYKYTYTNIYIYKYRHICKTVLKARLGMSGHGSV